MSDQTVGRIEQLTHTPGPWEWDGKFTVSIPHARGVVPFRVMPEDARLIAAAPDLLAACKAVLAQFDAGALQRNIDRDGDEDWAIKAIEPLNALSLMAGAIAKAEGRS